MSSILVVDDDDMSRELLIAFLGGRRHTVIGASTGQEGIDKFRSDKPDIVFMDIRLPDMNGVEVIRYIRSNFSSSRVRIIATTGNASANEESVIREAGFDDFLSKPLDLDRVLRAVELGC